MGRLSLCRNAVAGPETATVASKKAGLGKKLGFLLKKPLFPLGVFVRLSYSRNAKRYIGNQFHHR